MRARLRSRKSPRRHAGFIAILLLAAGLVTQGWADTVRTQTLTLKTGWNAVYLQVTPLQSSPAALFGSSPVDVVASYIRTAKPSQYVNDPGVDMLKSSAWNVWYAPGRPDAFLTTLHAVNGPVPLLIHALEDTEVAVEGGIAASDVRWLPDAFTLVGANLISGEEPTFAQYFSGSPAHSHNRIYRLVDGRWKQILSPSTTAMKAGEAFWIYTEGSSTYPGPLEVTLPSPDGIYLDASTVSVAIRNTTPNPLQPYVNHLSNGDLPVPLALVVRSVGDPDNLIQEVASPLPDGDWDLPMPPLEAGLARKIPLQLRREAMTAPVQSSLLRITSDLGTETWIPVIGVRQDLESNL